MIVYFNLLILLFLLNKLLINPLSP